MQDDEHQGTILRQAVDFADIVLGFRESAVDKDAHKSDRGNIHMKQTPGHFARYLSTSFLHPLLTWENWNWTLLPQKDRFASVHREQATRSILPESHLFLPPDSKIACNLPSYQLQYARRRRKKLVYTVRSGENVRPFGKYLTMSRWEKRPSF